MERVDFWNVSKVYCSACVWLSNRLVRRFQARLFENRMAGEIQNKNTNNWILFQPFHRHQLLLTQRYLIAPRKERGKKRVCIISIHLWHCWLFLSFGPGRKKESSSFLFTVSALHSPPRLPFNVIFTDFPFGCHFRSFQRNQYQHQYYFNNDVSYEHVPCYRHGGCWYKLL